MSIGLTRQEKERLVLKLYNQGKSYHEIAKEARVSLRDIGPILNRGGIQQTLSNSSRAYKSFHGGEERLKQMCKEGAGASSYLDCENILRCMDGVEQEVMKCANGYPAANCYR